MGFSLFSIKGIILALGTVLLAVYAWTHQASCKCNVKSIHLTLCTMLLGRGASTLGTAVSLFQWPVVSISSTLLLQRSGL